MRKPRNKTVSPNPTVYNLQRQVSTNAQKNFNENTILYGEDDALPLRIAKLVQESPATQACISTRAKYIKGASFSDPNLMNKKVDKYGTTLWQLHSQLSDIISLYEGFSVNLKFDTEGKITNTYILPFESCRLEKPDESGYVHNIKYNPYFGTQEYQKTYTCIYPVYDRKTVLNQINEYTTSYKGQVYYYGKTRPLYRFYPVPDYWSAKRWIEVDARIQEFHAENLENGFFQSVLMNVIGNPNDWSTNPKYQKTVEGTDGTKRFESTKTVGEEFNEMMSEAFSGSRKAGTALALWSNNQDSSVKIQAFPTNTNADLFTALQDLTTKNITIACQVPGILANISEGVNLGSGGSEIQKAVELMQSRIIEQQQELLKFYNEVLLPNMQQPISSKVEIVNYTPITTPIELDDKFWEVLSVEEKRLFIRKNFPTIDLSVVQTTPAIQPNQQPAQPDQPIETPEQSTVNDALKGLKISDINRIQKIVNRYERKLANPEDTTGLSYDQAKQLLSSFGFNEEQISAWLSKPEEEEEI